MCMSGHDGYTLKTRPILNRFWMKVAVARPDDCWEWTGTRKKQVISGKCYDYGLFRLPKQVPTRSPGGWMHEVRAHRFAWEVANAEALRPDDVILHSCDNPPCVNPAHLSKGTNVENMADMVAKGRQPYANRQQCPQGHDVTVEGAIRVIRRRGRTENACVACARARSLKWARKNRERAAQSSA